MKTSFYLICVFLLLFTVHERALGQVMFPSCPNGYHVDIFNSAELSSLQNQVVTLDTASEDLRKKREAAKNNADATKDQDVADQLSQDKNVAMSAMIIEQGRNMRCVPNQ